MPGKTKELCEAVVEFLNDAEGWGFLKRGSVSASIDMLMVDYEDFSDLRAGAPIGEEPLYELDANVIQVFVSFWY